jgi:hypothetical protein
MPTTFDNSRVMGPMQGKPNHLFIGAAVKIALVSLSLAWWAASIKSNSVRPPSHVGRGDHVLISFLAAMLSLVIIFTLLKINVRTETAQKSGMMFTGAIPSSPASRKSSSSDPTAAFLAPPSVIQSTRLTQSAVVDSSSIPLPRPRPKRL